uniref:Uncharacterized protein n=1 Tax=Arundo donax TaxID=35708 RepID=A0A0A8ZDQ7_ARUDO
MSNELKPSCLEQTYFPIKELKMLIQPILL